MREKKSKEEFVDEGRLKKILTSLKGPQDGKVLFQVDHLRQIFIWS